MLNDAKGFKKVYNLDKGITNWIEEGREITTPQAQ